MMVESWSSTKKKQKNFLIQWTRIQSIMQNNLMMQMKLTKVLKKQNNVHADMKHRCIN